MERRRSRARSLRDRSETSRPPISTDPEVGSSSVPAIVSKVLLPEPLGPITATNSPARTEIDADLSVRAGVLVAVMGPSGSGKSTLLTIAGTLEEPTSGSVLIGGRDVSDLSRNDRARLRRRSIGYVFQAFNLLAGLTAAENVALPLELDGTRSGVAQRAARVALDQLGLGDRAGHYPDQLSGGESQLVQCYTSPSP